MIDDDDDEHRHNREAGVQCSTGSGAGGCSNAKKRNIAADNDDEHRAEETAVKAMKTMVCFDEEKRKWLAAHGYEVSNQENVNYALGQCGYFFLFYLY